MVPVLYYDNIPRHSNADVTIILEPVIATSKTIKAAISILKSAKFGDKIKIISLIASREGRSGGGYCCAPGRGSLLRRRG